MALTYITLDDIYKTYPQESLDKLTGSDNTIVDAEELTVIEDVKGYLRARYDVDAIFATEAADRNKKLIQVIVDIMVYNLLSRLNNADIPSMRKERFDGNDPRQTGGAMGWLKAVAKGTIQPDLPLNDDNQTDQTGNIVIYGDAEDSKDDHTTF